MPGLCVDSTQVSQVGDGTWPGGPAVSYTCTKICWLGYHLGEVRRVFPRVRPKGSYRLSLDLLAQAKELDPGLVTKSGIIVGMGETKDEVVETMRDLRRAGCDLLTIGQYLRPSEKHLPVARFYTPEEFAQLRDVGQGLGFRHVASGPLVRSSYHADEQHAAASETMPV